MLTRRQFLGRSAMAAAGSALLPALPSFLTRAALAAQQSGAVGAYGNDTILVVIQMSGGNDGLNTVVPYGLDGYYQARPSLGIKQTDVLPLTDQIGLHPSMGKIQELYQQGQVAIVQGAGYANPILSHFRAMDIWQTAAPDAYESRGWLSNYLSSTTIDDGNPIFAASVTGELVRALYGNGISVPTIASMQAYQFRTDGRYASDRPNQLGYANWVYGQDYMSSPLQAYVARTGANAIKSSEEVQAATSAYSSTVTYPNFPLATSLKTVAQLMAAELGTRIFYATVGGFDTHSGQANTQVRLLGGFSDSVSAFLQDAAQMGKADRVLMMTFSEFGRRVKENGSNGTDHGTAGPMFVMGSRVRGGLYGDHPSLTALDDNKNLIYGVDFRSVYGTTLDGWLGADHTLALGARYENVGFV
jgi:uncharacterized protein (DUF1501 family)